MVDNTLRQQIYNLLNNVGARQASFVQLAGEDIGKGYAIEVEPLFIGRGKDCAVYVDDDQVSRQHAKVLREAEGIFIYDLNSTNGTLVNGTAIQRHRLEDGDRVQIGSFTVLKFNYQDELESSFNEELYNSANRDFLTQVYNKKYLVDRLRMEFSFARRHNTPLSLIMFDVDLFKQINDSYGHLVGDEVLKEVCERIQGERREEDVFARFGGEEFIVLLRAADGESAFLIAEKLRKVIADKPFVIGDKIIVVNISLGVAALEDDNFNSVDEFLLKADSQLYRAKREGRNRTCR